jgi:hypothetical protein
LKSFGLYYDRRKNHYRNQGIPASKIVTLPYLSQAVASIVLQKPDDARARPTTVADRNYKNMFSDQFPIEHYAKCALLLKRVDSFLDGAASDRAEKSNLMFHLSMYVACASLSSVKPNRGRIASMDVDGITEDLMKECFDRVIQRYKALGESDRVAKGQQFAEELRVEIKGRFGKPEKETKSGGPQGPI